MKNKPKAIITWLIRVSAIISAILVILVNNDYKALKLIIIFLVYTNIILLIKFLANQFRTFAVWKFIDESIKEIENNKDVQAKTDKDKYVNSDKAEFMGDGFKEVMGSAYGELVLNVKRILKVVKIGVRNTEINEKMNIELVNNLTNKLDKPLNDILDNVNKLNDSEEDENQCLQILTKKSKNLNILIEELFEVSKVASGDLQVEFHNIEIVALLKQSFIEYKDKIDDSSLIFRLNVPSEKISVNANGEKLWRVFDILIQNTLKHSLENSRVYIDVVNFTDTVSIKFRNTSKTELNIEPKDLVHVMNSNEEEDASGLGLEIARNLVALQNGKFNLEIDADLFKVEIIFNKCGE